MRTGGLAHVFEHFDPLFALAHANQREAEQAARDMRRRHPTQGGGRASRVPRAQQNERAAEMAGFLVRTHQSDRLENRGRGFVKSP